MPSPLIYLTEGARIFQSSLKNRFVPKRYAGNAQEICQQIVKDCWNGRYFQTSTGNFAQFWTRDFGWCTGSLLKLGYREEVQRTLRYALHRFREQGKITTTITPKGKAYDFPSMAVDSLPWLIHSMKLAKFSVHDYRLFLEQEVKKFAGLVLNPATGLVTPERPFSSIKDLAIRKSSCYDNCMLAMLSKDLQELKLHNPFRQYDYGTLLKEHLWNGKYFYDDLQKQDYVAGDANLFPFVLGIIKDDTMLKSALKEVHAAGLDEPLPLKYTNSRKGVRFVPQEIFLRNYESNAVWTHMGPLYIKLLHQIDPGRAEGLKKKYGELIEEHGNYLEVFAANGKPFRTPFYYCDAGMLWAANWLTGR